MGLVYGYGDSILASCNDYVAFLLGTRGLTWVPKNWGGTAPCDWLADVQSISADFLTEVVVSFSGNMLTPCTQGRGSQEQVYREDFGRFADICAARGFPVVWCSSPGPVGSWDADNLVANVMRQVAQAHGQRYVRAGLSLAMTNGWYDSWLPCTQVDQNAGWCYLGVVGVRTDDGVHLTQAGQFRYAAAIAQAV